MTGQLVQEVCPCCMGSKYQTNLQTGIKELCKCCGGTGTRTYMSDGSTAVIC